MLLAVWLPFFSGNAMASSIAMQAMSESCQMMAAQPGESPMHGGALLHRHTQDTQPAADQNQAAESHEQPNPSCNNLGVCHFACVGYLATLAIAVSENKPSAQTYTQLSVQFQSITTAPLDPPPLVRV